MEFGKENRSKKTRTRYLSLVCKKNTQKGRLYFGYLDFCANRARGVVMDAGTGDGRFAELIKDKEGVEQVYGTDFSERALNFSKVLSQGPKFSVQDLRKIDFEDKKFDTIFLIETLEHIPPEDIPTIVNELKRVLKDDGELFVTVPSVLEPFVNDGKHYQHFTKESLTKSLEPMNIKEIYGQNFPGFHIFKVFYKLASNKIWRINPIADWYNTKIWPKTKLNICEAGKGKRLIAVATK